MGTAKRERQKANRQLRYEALAKQQQRQKRRRRGLQFGIIIPVIVAAVSLILFFVTRGDGKNSADTTIPTDTAVTDTTDVTATTEAVTTTTIPPTPCPKEDGSSTKQQTFTQPMADNCIDDTKVYLATVETNKGTFTIELDPGISPITVNNFVALARYHFFDDTTCHRIITGALVQCGSPDASPNGGPGYDLPDELPTGPYLVGSVAMARAQAISGSQFFIVTGEAETKLAPNYNLVGHVTDGMDSTVKAMDAAGSDSGTPSEPIQIKKVTISVKEGATASTTTTEAPTTSAVETSST